MELVRTYVFLITILLSLFIYGQTSDAPVENTTHNCPFTRIIEDIFKKHNKTNSNTSLKDDESAKLFLEVIDNIDDHSSNKIQEDIINSIIESIKRIKENITRDTQVAHLNEAIILNDGKTISKNNHLITVNQIRSGIEEKIDGVPPKKSNGTNTKNAYNEKHTFSNNTSVGSQYVEILTIEPNNTFAVNTSSNNIIEVLKHIMPLFNSTVNKQLHSITIIEKNENKNHSVTETKNTSTVLVKYCDKDNTTHNTETVKNLSDRNDYLEADYYDLQEHGHNVTTEGIRDILEAAEYGMQKMTELYTVVEPKLYSMGYWLDDKSPARYVAAFNAPSEDLEKYSRYGYASVLAAAKLKELSGDTLESRTDEIKFPTASALRQSPLLEQCPLRGPPKCPPASKRYRTHDGTCNNLNRPRWGSTMTPVQRFLPPVYSDGIQAPRRSVFGSLLPSAREISALVHEDQNVENPGITHLLMQWGQFLDHDMVSSSQSRGFNGSVPRCCKDGGRDFIPKEFLHPECFPIAVPLSDPFYGPRGVRCLDFIRSSPAPQEDCRIGWREQINQVSAYIDGSPLYASSARQSDKLRLFRNGMLQYGRVQQRRPLLPTERRDELCRGGALSADCFKSGDARVNEQPGLVAAHILWLRQHNRMATELAHLNPHWSDEKIYQETRKIIGAMIQHITYREFLPIILGPEVMNLFELEPQKKGYYRGYNPKINPSPASSFASAAFRFGHSLVQPSMIRFDRFHRPMANNVSLHDEHTNPSNIWSMGAVDRLMLGMMNQPIQKRDEFITEELTNHLFQTSHFDFGMDLAAINIQRGRDHGVPPYTSWREPCGLSSVENFDDLSRIMPARVVRKMKALYKNVEDIDLFTGGMSERPVIGGLVGPTFACIIAQQFSNLRKGDRFWYENGGSESSFTPAQLQQIRRMSLAQVLCRTLDTIDSIQPFVFLSPDNPDNNRISCFNNHLDNFDLSAWVEINSNNELRKANEDPSTTSKPKPSTSIPITTTKKQKITPNHSSLKTHLGKDETKVKKQTHVLNLTDSTTNDTDSLEDVTLKGIDDKLDFRNKTKRFNDDDINTRRSPNKQYGYNDNVQTAQSVVINNLPQRPNRPYLSVTENIDKYTYLINYVPRTTQSWRQTTRRNYDRDVVKVTYQTYDDTYRRPNRPYFNRGDLDHDYESRNNARVVTGVQSSARSNDDLITTRLTDRPMTVTEKTPNFDSTTENLYKLLTFGYVGSYRGDLTEKNIRKDFNDDKVSKDFATSNEKQDTVTDNGVNAGKLSTFFLYESATRPFNSQRPTRHNNDQMTRNTKTKYYYVDNVLKKYSDNESLPKENDLTKKNETIKENIEERSVPNKIAALDDKKTDRPREREKKPMNSAKTPSVTFDIIPSESSPTQWAVYEEKEELIDPLHNWMPAVKTDPLSLRELPRPMDFSGKRRLGRQ
ncbi:uncharacterized protein LOC125057685 [Pieris napi]|uniref:uncharacterized protein LOC125057685 n=1 Tax=Pieris napi TaxID=78633 RepID=UPI001FBADFC7|nr:uncharacterized protein LOC125057685 [Pieris napi]